MSELRINDWLALDEDEIELVPIRAAGPGGQNVNKVSSAVHLRFDIGASSLPQEVKEKLLELRDDRVSRAGVIVIKGQRHRTREKNRADALDRLAALIADAVKVQAPRRPTRPSRGARQRRMDGKTKRATVKRLRGKPTDMH